jgi:hypothetical protein
MVGFVAILFRVFLSWNPLGYWSIVAIRYVSSINGFEYPRRRISFLKTDLVVGTAGASASYSFIEYLKQHNPEICIAHHHHCEYPMVWARALYRPRVFLVRDYDQYQNTIVERFPKWKGSRFKRKFEYYFGLWVAGKTGCLIFKYEDVVGSPDKCIERINQAFRENLNPGDGKLCHVRLGS